MKPRFALSAKIFLIAFANLLLLAVVAVTFARFGLGFEFNSRLVGPAHERVISMAWQMALDLQDTPADSREQLVTRYARTYGVQFYLFEQPGEEQIAGPRIELPGVVREELRRPPPREEGPPDTRGRGPEGRGHGRPPGPKRTPPLFEASTKSPSLYWVGAGIPLRDPDSDEQRAVVILMSAPSFVGTPLFFDYKPWLWVTAAMIGVFLLCWLPFIRGLTRAVREMSIATGQIAEGHFEQKLPETRRDELGLLAGSINRMSLRLAGFVTGQKRFLGDIAHELCAPIARTQFALGILERKAEEGATDDLQEEIRYMSALVSELLSFSKAGMLQNGRALVALSADQPLRSAVERETTSLKIEVTVDIEPGLRLMADPENLTRAVSNLVRNAIRYAGEAGPIFVTARREQSEVVITVSDCGPGLPESEAEQVFTPFYRLENSRNRTSGGVGLGLAIVRNCIEACKGTVRCRNRVPTGLEVEIRLMAAY